MAYRMRRRVLPGLIAILIGLGWLGSSAPAGDERFATSRFFLEGDGRLHIRNAKTGREADVRFVNPDGSLDESALGSIDEVFDFSPRRGIDHICARLLFMLDHFSDRVAPGKVIHLTSGYRSPEYNSKLRTGGGNVASTSLHQDGMALDFNIEGVDGRELWRIIKEADCCGVGHYGGPGVHLDSARPRFWEATTSRVRTGESDHNRRMWLSTDFDRYRAGEPVWLSLVSISDFGFGVSGTARLVRDREGEDTVRTVQLAASGDPGCITVADRESARAIRLTLPELPGKGRYRVRLDFCRRPFEDMPAKVVSNEIEVTDSLPR